MTPASAFLLLELMLFIGIALAYLWTPKPEESDEYEEQRFV